MENDQRQQLTAPTDSMGIPMDEKEKQGRALRALRVAAISGFMEDVRATQESCLGLCNACREALPVQRLRITRDVPLSILANVFPGLQQAEIDGSSGSLPHQRVLGVHWTMGDSLWGKYSGSEESEEEEEGTGGVEGFPVAAFRTDGTVDISRVQWPEETREIAFSSFNRCITNVTWPAGLERLWFSEPKGKYPVRSTTPGIFNMPLARVTFPAGLQRIFLGDCFNQPIDGVAWRRGLERLSLPGFNQSIQNVQWPPGLKALEFVSPSKIAMWADWSADTSDWVYTYLIEDNAKEILAGVGGFDQPLGSTLPSSLETLWISRNFRQPLYSVHWPSGLVVLDLAFDFRVYRHFRTIIWPSNLQKLFVLNKRSEETCYPRGSEVSMLKVFGRRGSRLICRIDNFTEYENPNGDAYDSEEFPDDY